MKAPRAPAHLATDTARWWRQTHKVYDLEEWQTRLLTLAGEAWDRTQQARELLARDGLCVEGREGGLRPHPAVAIERDSRLAFAKLIRDLNLETGEPARPVGRPNLIDSWKDRR